MSKHCATCTCEAPAAAEPEYDKDFKCDGCGVAWLNHSRPDVGYGWKHTTDCRNRCPHCGSEDNTDLDHREGCPTIGTCAACSPHLPRSEWHTEDEWLGDARFTVAAYRAHIAEAHS